ILGHSPAIVSRAIKTSANNGLLYGSPNQYAFDLAELVVKCVPCAEQVRFCTTGAEATMYAVRLARAFTKRKLVVKMAGGWHGYSSALTVGVSAPYDTPESAGLVSEEESFVKLAEFNNIEATKNILNENRGDIACVIIEPVMGAGGVIPAQKEYLAFLREECDRLGIVLIFDEIITGFRLALGGAQEHFGIKPDLCTLGKILGGGLPVSAIVGRTEIMSLADVQNKSKSERCWIGGGTFSENALCMKAGIATLKHLASNKRTIYKTIGNLGSSIRKQVDSVFSDHGIRTQTTGLGSLFATHFLTEGQEILVGPRDVDSSNRAQEKKYYFNLISKNNIYFIPGHIGAISTAHLKSDVSAFIEATEEYAQSETS
ncbi:MAG: aminotransferase class III-fold pyridoxal phosphate-dependent enzyme, partial [Thaumarchaeota archaeon]|nr:aminotransferase class III-fold pyridoxal phosphate-dependent enzyme [Nitrososphaerota archaeon]